MSQVASVSRPAGAPPVSPADSTNSVVPTSEPAQPVAGAKGQKTAFKSRDRAPVSSGGEGGGTSVSVYRALGGQSVASPVQHAPSEVLPEDGEEPRAPRQQLSSDAPVLDQAKPKESSQVRLVPDGIAELEEAVGQEELDGITKLARVVLPKKGVAPRGQRLLRLRAKLMQQLVTRESVKQLLGPQVATSPKIRTAQAQVNAKLVLSDPQSNAPMLRGFAVPNGPRGHAYIRRVMLEAYQMSMLTLHDVASRMEELNRRRKEFRKEKLRLSKLKAGSLARASDLGMNDEEYADWLTKYRGARREAEDAYQRQHDADYASYLNPASTVEGDGGTSVPELPPLSMTEALAAGFTEPVRPAHSVSDSLTNMKETVSAKDVGWFETQTTKTKDRIKYYDNQSAARNAFFSVPGVNVTTALFGLLVDGETAVWRMRIKKLLLDVGEAVLKGHSLEDIVSAMNPGLFVRVTKTLMQASYDYRNEIEGVGLYIKTKSRGLLGGVLRYASQEQVNAFIKEFPESEVEYHDEVDRALGSDNAITQTMKRRKQPWTSPATESLKGLALQAYEDLMMGDTTNDEGIGVTTKERVERLKGTINEMSAEEAKQFFGALAEYPIEGVNLSELFAYLSPVTVFHEQSPSGWEFLESLTEPAPFDPPNNVSPAEFYAAWTGSAGADDTRGSNAEDEKEARPPFQAPDKPGILLQEEPPDGSVFVTSEMLKYRLEELEGEIEDANGDAQLRQLELQQQTQNQQQLMNSISNMGKAIHDTAMAITRNVGA